MSTLTAETIGRPCAHLLRLKFKHFCSISNDEGPNTEDYWSLFMTSSKTPLPPVGERLIWDMMMGIPLRQAAVVAHHLGMYDALAAGPKTLGEISEAIQVAPRVGRILLLAAKSLKLIQTDGNTYQLTEVASTYLVSSSPHFFGPVLDGGLITNGHVFSFETVKKAALSNKAQVYDGEEVFESHEAQIALARAFTHMMHCHALGPALMWPTKLDLSEHRRMLDIGGGSGMHSIAATQHWPELKSTVFDLEVVCKLSGEYVEKYGAQGRVDSHVGDIWETPYPETDLHLYSDVFHDWPEERCSFLLKKSFDSMPSGGRVLLHEMLFSEDFSGPQAVAGYNVAMLMWTEGQQFAGSELAKIVSDAGFTDVKITPSLDDWAIIEGRKP